MSHCATLYNHDVVLLVVRCRVCQAGGGGRRRPDTPEETGLALGQYEKDRKKLDEERKNEYNQLIHKVEHGPSALPPYRPTRVKLYTAWDLVQYIYRTHQSLYMDAPVDPRYAFIILYIVCPGGVLI